MPRLHCPKDTKFDINFFLAFFGPGKLFRLHNVECLLCLWAREQLPVQVSIPMDSVRRSYFSHLPKNAEALTRKNDSHNLPTAVENLFTKQPPIKDVYELVIGPSGSFYIGYLDGDNKIYCMNHGLPFHLTKWLSNNAQGFVEHDIHSTMITLGPNGSYVVKDKNKMEFCGVPTLLAARLNRFGAHGTRQVTLGIDDSYVVVNNDGSGLLELSNRYPELEKSLAPMPSLENIHVSQDSRGRSCKGRGLNRNHFITNGNEKHISLSSYTSISTSGDVDDPMYALIMKNGSAEYFYPDGHEKNFAVVASHLRNLEAVEVQSPVAPSPMARSVVAQSAVRSPARASSSSSGQSFLKLLSGVAKAANKATKGLNGGGGGSGGGGDYNGGGDGGGFDTSGFQAGLQQQTWSTTSDAASDPIQ